MGYAGQHPELFKGVINFVGGWLGTGCSTAPVVNQTLFLRGSSYQGNSLWLYGDADPYYPFAHSRANFSAFQQAGGRSEFHEYSMPADLSGHSIVIQPTLWAGDLSADLARHGLPAGSP